MFVSSLWLVSVRAIALDRRGIVTVCPMPRQKRVANQDALLWREVGHGVMSTSERWKQGVRPRPSVAMGDDGKGSDAWF